ncbi:SPOR domain-containing protein [Stenotrophomonas mori]|uniref:SPOR domain-containing protein n=1 Tax=Stenotrophomonas mori TaxID=2871096 RepID=A0ABT0SKI4_9GAMM|nr:SPOR domain-containing protein [Stenotrophomonas mori]MCL7715847.1 SPOR domain-containing protein [Stenotrophomonas mori]
MAARRGKNQARRNSGNGTPGWVWLVAGAAIAAVVFLAAPNLFKKDGDGFLRVGPQPNPDAQPAPVADADIDAGAELPRPPARDEAPAATQYDFYTLLPGKEVQMSDAELAASAQAEEQRRAQAARSAPASEAQRAQAALEGRPVPPATAAALPAPISEAPRPAATGEAPRTAAATPAATPAPATPPAPAATAPAAAADNVRYILQAGAFGASGDAEATKAKLAMMGLTARVESAQINGNTVYRVRMGPYGTAGELAEAKAKLDGSGLQAMAIKAQ